MTVHLEGMGLLGSLTALKLKKLDVPFTWHDADKPVNAWGASTGACYPSGGAVDRECHEAWGRWLKGNTFPADLFETCAYWVDGVHRSLPHGLEAGVEDVQGGMRLCGRSIHVNVQGLVERVRGELEPLRRRGPSPGAVRVVAHGFGVQLDRYLWGWTRLVRLRYPAAIARHGRPSFYLRKNRFQFAYCYPKPGTDWWYAGSHLVSQRVPKRLDPVKRYGGWRERFEELSGRVVMIAEEGEFLQGWRPCRAGGLSAGEGYKAGREDWAIEGGGKIHLPTLASNGFRHYPAVWRSLGLLLGLVKPSAGPSAPPPARPR